MFGTGIVVAVVVAWVVLAIAVAGAVALVYRSATRSPVRPRMPAAGGRWTLVLAVRLLALLVGVAVAVLLWSRDAGLGRGPMLSLAALGLCVLLGTAAGETLVRPTTDRGPRSASLTPRRIRDYLPRSTPLVAGAAVALLVTLVVTTATAGTDERGHHRELTCRTATVSTSHGPYAGAYYSVPLALMLLVVLGTALLAARQVVDRPRGLAATHTDDDLLRRSSLAVVVAATGVAVAAPLAGVWLTTGAALTSVHSAQPSCAAGWWGPAGVALLLLSLAALVVTLTCAGTLLAPARVPRLLHERAAA